MTLGRSLSSNQRPAGWPRRLGSVLLMLGFLTQLSAEVSLAPLFRDGAVLQRNTPIPVWGRARTGEQVAVHLGADTAAATAGADGRWFVHLPARPASAVPVELVAEGDNRIVVHDVLVGDVWLCGGQSNMMMAVHNGRDAEREIAAANFPQLRLFKIPPQFADTPTDNVGGAWQSASPGTVGNFSATAYFFGRELQTSLGIPVGLIVSSYGNTAIATWRSTAALAGDEVVAAWWRRQQQAKSPPRPHRQPSAGHNGMIAPLVPYAVRGFLWYQGETDATEAPALSRHYAAQLTGLIREWRALFAADQPLPFYWVQLAGFGHAAPRDWTGVREQQTRALALPATGQAIALDLGDATDIHPHNKQEVGTRLARLALHRTYGQEIVDTGPKLELAEVTGSRVTLRFDTSSLRAQGDLATAFELAGADGKFHRVDQASITGNTITFATQNVTTPVTVRFAWQDLPTGFLFNADGLPAAPFQFDLPRSP